MTKTIFIYALKEPDTGEIRYIGKANDVQKRLMNHISDREKNHRTNWIQSLSIRGLKPDLEIIDEVPRDLDQSAEMGYIHLYKSQGCNLVNGTPGGDGGPGMAGKTHTKEWREAASERMTGENHPMFGKHHSEASKQQMSASASVRPITEEGRAALRNREFSQERNDKIGLAHKGKKHTKEWIEAARQGRLAKGEAKFQKILQLQAEGKTQVEIGKLFGVGQDAISTFLQRRINS